MSLYLSTTYCLPTKRRFWQGDRPEWKAGNTLEIELDSKSPPIMKSCIQLQTAEVLHSFHSGCHS